VAPQSSHLHLRLAAIPSAWHPSNLKFHQKYQMVDFPWQFSKALICADLLLAALVLPQDPISASLLVHVLHLCVRLRVQQIDTEDVIVGSSWYVGI